MNRAYTRDMMLFFVTLLSCLFQSAYAVEIDKIIVFGDSLSDNGNIFSLTSKAHKIFSSVPITPKNPPYFDGRFSNGPVWIDVLAAAMNVPLVDYAYGGAWAEPLHDSRIMVPFSIGMQVNYYLVAAVTDFYKANHLYVIWAGGNDYAEGREDPDYATTNTVATIESQIDWLIYVGAKNIMVMNLPDLSLVPEVSSKGPNKMHEVRILVNMHNDKLQAMVIKQQAKNPEVKLVYADITPFFNDTYYHPEKYNIKNVTTPCYSGDYSMRGLIVDKEIAAAKKQNIDILNNPSLRAAYLTGRLAELGVEACDTPDEYMFWDQIHPTRVVHKIMASHALNILAENDIQGAKPSRK
jgi:phospholipase/lecithinase/hemolysin